MDGADIARTDGRGGNLCAKGLSYTTYGRTLCPHRPHTPVARAMGVARSLELSPHARTEGTFAPYAAAVTSRRAAALLSDFWMARAPFSTQSDVVCTRSC